MLLVGWWQRLSFLLPPLFQFQQRLWKQFLGSQHWHHLRVCEPRVLQSIGDGHAPAGLQLQESEDEIQA